MTSFYDRLALLTPFSPARGTVAQLKVYPENWWDDLESVATEAILEDVDERGAGWFIVTDPTYGATGDGSTDDAAAIQAAIDACEAAGGGIVYVPKGTYMIGTALQLLANDIRLQGAGVGASTIKMANGANLANMVIFGSLTANLNYEYVGMSDIGLHGNKANNTGAATNAALRIMGLSRVKFFNINIINMNGVGLMTDNYHATENTPATNSGGGAYTSHYSNIRVGYCVYSGFQIWGANNQCFSDLIAVGCGVTESTSGAIGFEFDTPFQGNTATGRYGEVTGITVNNLISSSCYDGGIKVACTKLSNFSNITVEGVGSSTGIAWEFNESRAFAAHGSNIFPVNSCTFTNITLRGGPAGDLVQHANAELENCLFSNLVLGSSSQQAGSYSALLRGARACRFIGVQSGATGNASVGAAESVFYLTSGTPLGGSSQSCTDIVISGLHAHEFGKAQSGAGHGIHADDVDGLIVSDSVFESSEATSANTAFAINVASGCQRVLVSGCSFKVDAGQEAQIASGAEDEVRFRDCDSETSWSAEPVVASPASTIFTVTDWPLWAAGHIIEVTGTNNVKVIPIAPNGSVFDLHFTDAAPGDVLDGSVNILCQGGANLSPAQYEIVTIRSDGANWHARL